MPPSLCSFFFHASSPAAAGAVTGWGMAAGMGNLWPCHIFCAFPARAQGATVPGAAVCHHDERWQCGSHAEGKGIFTQGKTRGRDCLVLVFLWQDGVSSTQSCAVLCVHTPHTPCPAGASVLLVVTQTGLSLGEFSIVPWQMS